MGCGCAQEVKLLFDFQLMEIEDGFFEMELLVLNLVSAINDEL